MAGKVRGLSHVAFVRHHPDLTSDVLLREDDTILQESVFRTEIHSIIQLARPSPRDELVAKLPDLRVHDKTL
jgi:hypothetical protein